MNKQRSWGLMYGRRGMLMPFALQTRMQVMEWVAQRYISSVEYDTLTLKAQWELAKKRHPDLRIVRVTVSEEPPHV